MVEMVSRRVNKMRDNKSKRKAAHLSVKSSWRA